MVCARSLVLAEACLNQGNFSKGSRSSSLPSNSQRPCLETWVTSGAEVIVHDDPIPRWALALRDKSGWQKAVVALANKNARILWAVMTKGKPFDARHVSVMPTAAMAPA